MRILVAEDERDMNRVICKKLQREGWCPEPVYDGREALDYLRAAEYDAAIMDVMLPYMDGFEVVRRARALDIATPILFLTARCAVEDRVQGLDVGGDDYLSKPFSFEELMARLRVMTRRSVGSRSNMFRVADLEVDLGKHTVRRGEHSPELSAREFALLEYLIRNRGVILTREQIEDHVWGSDYEGASNVVDVYIGYLRKKLDTGFEKRLLHTVRGMGYVLREEAER